METTNALAWVFIGIALIGLEVFTGTFYLLFVGFAALLTAGLVYLVGPLSWTLEGAFFAILSLGLAWFVKVRKFHKSEAPSFQIDEKITFVCSEDLAPGETKNILYQGAPWSAENVSEKPIHKGKQVRIVQTQSIRLLIEPVEEN